MPFICCLTLGEVLNFFDNYPNKKGDSTFRITHLYMCKWYMKERESEGEDTGISHIYMHSLGDRGIRKIQDLEEH